jgi:hypothetical protein
MDILDLICVRAHREHNFALYVESLKALVLWFLALDHQNYARWISVHIRNMESLSMSIHVCQKCECADIIKESVCLLVCVGCVCGVFVVGVAKDIRNLSNMRTWVTELNGYTS